MNKQLLTDYKRWLLYSFDKQGFDQHYNLFKALQTATTFGGVAISKSVNDDQVHYIVSVDKVEDELHISEKQRREFLNYLTENYFKSDDIDAAKQHRVHQENVAKNVLINERTPGSSMIAETEFILKPHAKETTYFNVLFILSMLIYGSVASVVVFAILNDFSVLISSLFFIPVILIVALMRRIMKGIFLGLIRGNSIRITKQQFPEIYDIIEQQARILKVEVPEIYVTYGHFNAFVTKFLRAHILMIYSEVVETTLNGDYSVLKYVTAHELCHIKQKHLAKRKYLFGGRLIPFLGLAYSRGCEYTCDRVGYEFSPKGSIEGILIMTTGKAIYSKFNVEVHIKTSVDNEGVWTWLSEKFLTHPHLYKRLIAVKEYSRG